jgi:hypothetical protein
MFRPSGENCDSHERDGWRHIGHQAASKPCGCDRSLSNWEAAIINWPLIRSAPSGTKQSPFKPNSLIPTPHAQKKKKGDHLQRMSERVCWVCFRQLIIIIIDGRESCQTVSETGAASLTAIPAESAEIWRRLPPGAKKH